ncbi:MAG: sodium:solute symporter family protein [Cyanobacteria bacterium J06621_11]
MQSIDWFIVIAYLIFTLSFGIYLSRRAFGSVVDFFAGGRSLSWWLAGTSMAATTFSVDTPLYIAGIVGNRGLVGNWEWWSFGFSHVLMIYLFARLWRRSEIVTDAELSEIRYGGQPAAVLRGTKAFLFAVPMNCLGMGYAMLAMTKVMAALQIWQGLGFGSATNNFSPDAFNPDTFKLWSVLVISVLVLLYAGLTSLWNVVSTDFFQFFLALLGSFVVAIAATNAVGGIRPLVEQLSQFDPALLSFIPFGNGSGGFSWNLLAGIPSSTFLAYVMLQWWSFRRSDGGGEFIQRLAATQSEADAEKAAWLFNGLHYVVRTWPLILAALAALVLYPDLADKELGYPLLMADTLPPILLGLVVTSLIAAFLSTVSTLVNWGAAYLSTDIYKRFISPNATSGELILMGRLASLLMIAGGGFVAFAADDVATLFRLAIALGTGPGLVLILRWFWWRISAATELAALLSGFVFGLLTSGVPGFTIPDFGPRLLVITLATTFVWVGVMLVTAPESDETLDRFYARLRPGGPGWHMQRKRTGLRPLQNLGLEGKRILAAVLLLFGSMFAVGGFLLMRQASGWMYLIIAVIGGSWLRQLNRQPAFPMARPGTEDG